LMSEKGMKRLAHNVETQRWVWAKVRELRETYDLGEGIDVIADALILYEVHLKEKAREPRAAQEDPAYRDQDVIRVDGEGVPWRQEGDQSMARPH